MRKWVSLTRIFPIKSVSSPPTAVQCLASVEISPPSHSFTVSYWKPVHSMWQVLTFAQKQWATTTVPQQRCFTIKHSWQCSSVGLTRAGWWSGICDKLCVWVCVWLCTLINKLQYQSCIHHLSVCVNNTLWGSCESSSTGQMFICCVACVCSMRKQRLSFPGKISFRI